MLHTTIGDREAQLRAEPVDDRGRRRSSPMAYASWKAKTI